MSKVKVLVTGGCGFIGSHTIIELIRKTDFEIISVDNNVKSHLNTIDRIDEITGKRVKNYTIDLADKAATEVIFQENPSIDGIIHFAALKSVPESVDEPLWYYQNNLNSLLNLLEFSTKYKVPNLIFSSSCSIYGNVEKLPVTEETPFGKAECPYANTKQMGEEIIEHFTKVNDVNCISLRYFNPVGADHTGKNGENPIDRPNNLVPVITQTASGIIEKMTVFGGEYETRDGSCIRDYIHVTDIANAHILALQYLLEGKNEGSRYDVFNLGTGNGVTVLEAIHAFEKVSGLKLNYEVGPPRQGDVVAIYSDSSKALKKLGWECALGIEDMMLSAWKWQQLLNKEKAEGK